MATKRTISFNEALHTYTDEENNVYTSVTTVIGKYHPKFDENFWANKKAQELGISPDIVKANWKEIRDFSCFKGTKEHKLLEDSVNDSIPNSNVPYKKLDNNLLSIATVKLGGKHFSNVDLSILQESELAKKYPEIFTYLKTKIQEGYTLYVEKRVYWFEYLVAGTIDCLLIKGKSFIIVDWKTNKDELKFKAGYYKKVNGVKTDLWIDKKEYFFKPISNVEHCKGNIYTLQLSLYAYLLELWGFICEGLVLYHLKSELRKDDKGKHIEVIIPKSYNILYDKSSAQLLLIDHKNVSTQSKSNLINNNNTESFGIS